MEILYSCKRCRLRNTAVTVRERYFNETEEHWIEEVVDKELIDDHKATSPRCKTTVLINIFVPYLSKMGIGFEKREDETSEQVDAYWASKQE